MIPYDYLKVHLDSVVYVRLNAVKLGHHVMNSEVMDGWLQTGLLCIYQYSDILFYCML